MIAASNVPRSRPAAIWFIESSTNFTLFGIDAVAREPRARADFGKIFERGDGDRLAGEIGGLLQRRVQATVSNGRRAAVYMPAPAIT